MKTFVVDSLKRVARTTSIAPRGSYIRIAPHLNRRMVRGDMGLSLAGIQANGSARRKSGASTFRRNGTTQWQANPSVIPSKVAC
jgi:hypothetical protein